MLYRLQSFFAQSVCAAGIALAMSAMPAHADAIKRLEIVAPSGPGGGYDMTARGMQATLQQEGLVRAAQVVNISGASGTVGLAQFISSKQGRGDGLLVVGLVLEGGILKNKSPVGLDDVTPVARLLGEYEILVVPANSDIKSLDDLIAKLKADPQAVSWGGGGAGGVDHILAGLIGKAVGVEPSKVNYIAHDGGGQALASILGGHVTVGVNGVEEMMPLVRSGKLRALAVSAPQRIAGIDVPTLKEQGVDVELVNWRGVMAPPGISDKDRSAINDAIAKMVKSEAWTKLLKERGWIDLYQPADEFSSFLKTNGEQTRAVLTQMGIASQ